MNEISIKQSELLDGFRYDSDVIGTETVKFLELVYPSYLVSKENIDHYIDSNSQFRLEGMTFYRIVSCTTDSVDDLYASVNNKFEKLVTALHSIDTPIAYGIVSNNGITNLVLGVYSGDRVESVKLITQGTLTGLDMQEYEPEFFSKWGSDIHHGILSGVPSLYVNEQKQSFSLASIMRSLNGQNYTLLFVAKPMGQDIITRNISDLISVRDKAFAVSKRNIARSNNTAHNISETHGYTDGKNSIANQVGGSTGATAGAIIGSIIAPGIGTAIGGAIGGGLGTAIGAIIGQGETHTESYSKSISDTITTGDTISGDIQNGFAIELMNYADNAIERLKAGQNCGIWQTAIAYSAESDFSRNIIEACLRSELSNLDSEKLPMVAFEPSVSSIPLALPNFLNAEAQNPLCSMLNSAELGMLCTVPVESVPNFDLRIERKLPLIASSDIEDHIVIGNVVDGKRPLSNMPFGLSEKDLNKHTFVCGITGSGKTTTVKKILMEAKKPFLVIESAKKEYRNINTSTTVYTPGKLDTNAPKMNPFYIMPGISPQAHIDYLKDLFNASFSFYGPMPYILEKCLHRIYKNKGWNLTLGYHPLLTNHNSPMDFFSLEYTKKQYANISHKFLFPTMQDLKDEINRYIEEDLGYEGEVAGNVKTAMRVRLENLCVGAKGYTFNTNEYLDMSDILEKNVVFELEGLADDADKAFSVGLLVIFINEYRNIQKEIKGSIGMGLQHLLVIEEAHRLLKNINTESNSEVSGNPKGKAVEHFTNMIAEMRSYGQGVIVAEQIPTKLAPDVIKNSSTKIVQRVVSADDQQVIANTIGMSGTDSIQLGALESGYAYCHKEGMALPTPVKITGYYRAEADKMSLDVFVTDELLYNNNQDRFNDINLSTVRNLFADKTLIKRKLIALLNTLMVENEDKCITASERIMRLVEKEIKLYDAEFVLMNKPVELYAHFLSESMLSIMVNGVYRTKKLPDNSFVEGLKSLLYVPTNEKVIQIKAVLKKLYTNDLAHFAKTNIVALINRSLKATTDIEGTIREYFIDVSESTITELEKSLKREHYNL